MDLRPPLRLDEHYFEQIEVRFNPDYSEDNGLKDDGQNRLRVEVQIQKNVENACQFKLDLLVSNDLPDSTHSYLFTFRVVGIFTIQEDKLGAAGDLLRLTGAAILYGAAREMLILLSGRGPLPAIQLPTVSPKIFALHDVGASAGTSSENPA